MKHLWQHMMMYVDTHDILLEQLLRAQSKEHTVGLGVQQEGVISVRSRRSSEIYPSGTLGGTGLN